MTWELNASLGEFRTGRWHGHFDLANPEQGLRIVTPDSLNIETLLAVSFPKPHQASYSDCYTRLGDLIAVYPQRDARKFNVQLDYRVLESPAESLLLELWISIQTYLLDTHPTVSVKCRLETDTAIEYRADEGGELALGSGRFRADAAPSTASRLGPTAVVCGRVGDGGPAIAWFNHPLDQSDTTWAHSNHPEGIEARLFGHFLEKGVIRRGRMRCWIRHQPFDIGSLQEVYQAFATSPLPLTA